MEANVFLHDKRSAKLKNILGTRNQRPIAEASCESLLKVKLESLKGGLLIAHAELANMQWSSNDTITKFLYLRKDAEGLLKIVVSSAESAHLGVANMVQRKLQQSKNS